MLFAEDDTKKQLIFEKHDYFKIVKMGHYAKAMGKNLSFQKTFHKRLYRHIGDVLCNKRH